MHWIPLVLLALSSCLNLFFVFRLWHETNRGAQSSYESGFSSDLPLAKPEISLVKKPFTGGVELDHEGGFIIDHGGSKYVGKPSKELDAAWEELLSGLNIEIAHQDLDLSESTFRWPENGLYFSGLEVYHALHCLNRLRQAIYIEDYGYIFDRPGDPPLQHHVDHCINHIRQALQCQADLTPMEWKLEETWNNNIGGELKIITFDYLAELSFNCATLRMSYLKSNGLHYRIAWAAAAACLATIIFRALGYGETSLSIPSLIGTAVGSQTYLQTNATFECHHPKYSVEILSIDPFVLYINDFLSQEEIRYILDFIYEENRKLGSGDETVSVNERAPRFPWKEPLNVCLSQRMKSLLGNVQHIEIEPVRVIQYERNEKIQVHYDWFPETRNETGQKNTSARPNNRLGSILAYVDDDCEGGETYFPEVKSVAETADSEKFSISENCRGLLVKPKKGNAIFWNNLHANGSGDVRTAHAGMPVTRGTKVAINIWSYYFLDSPILG
ncbi:hypothetical protein NLU13_5691 [Sarocladium strictum]|uniref:Fe2OG dioxygenase domain-containing protein n=1 Tax=Sarocladium strictum TaxID=5046 RepID=A0AA39L863_SARSR|nr:hypothetical protein NLU13_5691 [Sarocladium strictum]